MEVGVDIPSREIMDAIASTGAVVVAGYFASYLLARHTLRGRSECPWELADVIFHVPFAPLVIFLVVRAVSELSSSGLEGRWQMSTWDTRAFLTLYVTQSTVHIGVLYLKRQVGSPAAYVAHHVLSVACYGHALLTGRMHFWAVFAALCEITNIPLNNLFIFKMFKWDVKFPLAYTINGALLWLTYLVFRMFLFPLWLLLFVRDVREQPALTWDRIDGFERYAYAGTTALLLAISTLWLAKITSGLLSAIRGSKPSAGRSDVEKGSGSEQY
jgi:hypothetical protein